MTAPGRLPSPPMTVAMKAISMTFAPIWISAVPVWLPRIRPMAAASAPDSAKAPMMTRFARTPSIRAMVKFSAAARISSPKRVRRRNEVSPKRMATVARMVMTCKSGMRAPRISTGWLSAGRSEIDFGRLE